MPDESPEPTVDDKPNTSSASRANDSPRQLIVHSEGVDLSRLDPVPASVVGLRVVLGLQAAVGIVLAVPAYMVMLGLGALAGYDAEAYRGMGYGFILFVGLPALFQILAAIQVGRARSGGLYLGLAVIGTGVQALVCLLSVPFVAIPFVIMLIIQISLLLKPTAQARIGEGSNVNRPWLPDAIGLPVGLVIVAGLMTWNHVAFDPDNRHPHRDFDSAEAGSRLEDAIESTLPVFDEDQEFEIGDGNPDSCYDGVAFDTEYENYRLEYVLETRHQNPEQLFAEYVDVLRRHWESLGYEIVLDEVDSGIRDHVLEAERPDGVRLIFALYYDGAYVALSADSGCVKIADQQ